MNDSVPIDAEALLEVAYDFVCELQPHRRGRLRLTLESRIDRDLSIDSLARMELALRVERAFGIRLSEQAMARADTLRDVLRATLSAGAQDQRSLPGVVTEHSGIGSEARPEHAETLVDVLRWHTRHHPERVHIHLYGEDEQTTPLTYGALYAQALETAEGLRASGLEPGEAVAIMLPTCLEYFYAFLGTMLAGGVPVPIYPPARLSQMEDHVRRHAGILANAGAKVLVTFAEAKPVAMLLRSQVEGLRRVVTAGDLLGRGALAEPAPLATDDIAFLQYTSGSTGDPKGVILTHANILANIGAMDNALQTSSDDVFVSWLPLYHDMGLIGAWMGSLYVGFTLVLMSPLAFLARPARLLHAIHAHRGTVSGGPNFAFELCVRRVEDRDLEGLDLGSWRYAFNGAEPVSAATLRRFTERFEPYGLSPSAIAPVYGLAEATLGLTFPPVGRGLLADRVRREALARGEAQPLTAGEEDGLEVVACGQPMPGYEVRVVDEAERELPERRVGKLQFKGPSATSGYYRNPEATRALLRGEWLETGDLAYISAGDLFITSREKDMIIRAGRNIYPYELEEAVGELEGIRKGCVAVFGSPEPGSQTERIIVVAETREEDESTRARLRESIGELSVSLIGSPPDDLVLAAPRAVLKTSSGKLRRAATRERYQQGHLEAGGGGLAMQMLRLAGASVVPQIRRARRRGAELLRAGFAWSVAGALGAVCWCAIMLAPTARLRWQSMGLFGRLALRLTGVRVTVTGTEHLPQGGAFVLAANHQSYLDGPLLACVVPRRIHYVVKGELAHNLVLSPVLRRLGLAFVERFDVERSVQDSKRITALIGSGGAIGYFPEGTLRRMPGLLPFHMGAFVTAAESGVPIVPVTIRGTRSVLRDQSWFPRPGAVRVVIGAPLGAPHELSTWEGALELRNAVRAEMLKHCGEPDLAEHRVEMRAEVEEPAR